MISATLSASERFSSIISLAISAGGTSMICASSYTLRMVALFSVMMMLEVFVTGVIAP